MLTGGVPFGLMPEATFHAIKNEPVPPFFGQADHEIPPALQMLVLRALEDPERHTRPRGSPRHRLLQGRTVPLISNGTAAVVAGPRSASAARGRSDAPRGDFDARARCVVTPPPSAPNVRVDGAAVVDRLPSRLSPATPASRSWTRIGWP